MRHRWGPKHECAHAPLLSAARRSRGAWAPACHRLSEAENERERHYAVIDLSAREVVDVLSREALTGR